MEAKANNKKIDDLINKIQWAIANESYTAIHVDMSPIIIRQAIIPDFIEIDDYELTFGCHNFEMTIEDIYNAHVVDIETTDDENSFCISSQEKCTYVDFL